MLEVKEKKLTKLWFPMKLTKLWFPMKFSLKEIHENEETKLNILSHLHVQKGTNSVQNFC